LQATLHKAATSDTMGLKAGGLMWGKLLRTCPLVQVYWGLNRTEKRIVPNHLLAAGTF